MAKLISKHKTAEESHKALAKASKDNPKAECRVAEVKSTGGVADNDSPYEVYDGPDEAKG